MLDEDQVIIVIQLSDYEIASTERDDTECSDVPIWLFEDL